MRLSRLVFILLYCAILQQVQSQRSIRYEPFEDTHQHFGWKKKPDVWPVMKRYGIRFYDRISLVIINIKNYQNSTSEKTIVAPSVLISTSRLVTAYNPFRDILRNSTVMDKLVICFVKYISPPAYIRVHISEVVCGRQVAYMPDDELTLWHGSERKHSPVHDLMILRVDQEFKQTGFRNVFSYDYQFYGWGIKMGFIGPIRSYLARNYEPLGDTAVFYSLGYRNKKEMEAYDKIHPYTIESVQTSLVNCEEWMPRQWGYFICFKNEKNFAGLGAGAMLYSNNKLYGVGSFALFRNNSGILVFTDLRPYNEHIKKTCSDREFTHKW